MTPTIPITRTPPTPKQQRTLGVINTLVSFDGNAPTLQRVADMLGVSKVTAHEHVRELRRKGWLAEGRTIAVAGDAPAVPWALLMRTCLALAECGRSDLSTEIRRAMGVKQC